MSSRRWDRGDSDNALAETIIGLYKTEMVRNRGPWRGLDDLELATLEWVDWFNHRRLFHELGRIPPAEYEKNHSNKRSQTRRSRLTRPSLREPGEIQPDYGYAITGHKAQGATAQVTHTITTETIDREWVYVTMSRGRQANTLHIVQPETADDCTHLPHMRPADYEPSAPNSADQPHKQPLSTQWHGDNLGRTRRDRKIVSGPN